MQTATGARAVASCAVAAPGLHPELFKARAAFELMYGNSTFHKEREAFSISEYPELRHDSPS